jgi:hypothetical protein
VCSRHVSPLSERRITISRSMPRRDPKCGTSIITGLEESSYTQWVYFTFHRKTRTRYQNFKTKIIRTCCCDTHAHACACVHVRARARTHTHTHTHTHMYICTYTGKLPSSGTITDTNDKIIILNVTM